MSFYNVGPTNKFVVQNNDLFVGQKLAFLEAGFNQPEVGTTLNSLTNSSTITASQLVNAGYIARTGAGAVGYDLPSAAAIIAELNKNQSIRELSVSSSPVTVGVGFNWNLILNNKGSGTVTLNNNDASTVAGNTVSATTVSVLKLIVTNTAGGSEQVVIKTLA